MGQSTFIAQPKQAAKLAERKTASASTVTIHGVEFVVLPGVYDTSIDTELMIDSVQVGERDTILEIGCGTGAVSILLAQRCKGGVGVDINERAVENANRNKELLGQSNVSFSRSNGFEKVTGNFPVIICNPPYSEHTVNDDVDRMFWDPANEMKTKFFRDLHRYLEPDGRMYFGWANFADLDIDLPLRLAKEAGLQYVQTFQRDAREGKYQFLVIEFKRRN